MSGRDERRLQIGVMGSAADLNYGKELELLAERIGALIAQRDCVLLFGAEQDCDSLSTAAARGAKRAGGLAIGVTYGKSKMTTAEADVIIATGLERGGGRELSLVLSCDAVICLGGGSGTLTEIAIAYQAGIPVVVLEGTGGWAARLAGVYLDDRKRQQCEPAATAEEAVLLAINRGRERMKKDV